MKGILGKFKLPRPGVPDIFLAGICLFLIIYIVSTLTDSGVRFFIIRSGSMEPAIKVGDVVLVSPHVNPVSIKENDIIAFRSTQLNDVVIHRVIQVTPEGFITKGDANEDLDIEKTGAGSVIGIYRFRIPLLGFFFEGIRNLARWAFGETRTGWTLTIIASTFFAFSIRRRKPGSDSRKQEKGNRQ